MTKLILASGSKARQSMLRGAELDFDIVPADLDEAALIKRHEGSPEDIAALLAREKALDVAKHDNASYTIGSDQILTLNGKIFSKAKDAHAAREKLKALRGKTHRLISAVAVARGDGILWQYTAHADLTMHDFDDAFLETYMVKAGDALTTCVGAYALEAEGAWLFEKIEGDYFTILGMPLLPLLDWLRQEGFGP